MKSFDPDKHSLSYAAISGTPFFIKSVNARWSLTKQDAGNTKLKVGVQIETKGIMGAILKPVAKKKLGKLGDMLVDDLKYYVENGKPHARKMAALGNK